MSILPLASEPVSDPHRYSLGQRVLHWTMAVVILLAVAIGFYCSTLPPGTSPRRELLDLHKSLGMSAAGLLVVRIGYRLVRGHPPYRRPLGRLTRAGAGLGHLTLYGLMIAMPVTGYVYSGTGGYSLPFFGLFVWPRVVPLDKGLSHLGFDLHWAGAWAIAAVLLVHVLAVAWHGWVKRDEVPSRMMPAKRPTEAPV